jgi:phosphoribosylamine--glycine ligase
MEESVSLRPGAAVGVVVASEGYPDAPLAGRAIEGAEPSSPADDGDVLRFHGATKRVRDGGYETTGGRVATIVGRGESLAAARETAYAGIADLALSGGQYRTDVALRELEVGDRAELSHEAR